MVEILPRNTTNARQTLLSAEYKYICGNVTGLTAFVTHCGKVEAKQAANITDKAEIKRLREAIQTAQDWLDELDQYLPKAK